MGDGLIQLRLPIGFIAECYLCGAYVKEDTKAEKRKLAKFKFHIEMIRKQRVKICGRLS